MGVLTTEELLREVVRGHLREGRYLTLQGQNKLDLDMAIRWVQRNGKLRRVGAIERLPDDTYVTRVQVKGSTEGVANLIKDRFGYFVRIVR